MKKHRFQPAQALALSFLSAILVGTFLLWLPFSTESGRISLVDAFFTATSAICVTGLTVRDTATFFSPAGQAVILALVQLGGLGIMTFSTMILLVAGRKISFQDRIAVQEDFSPKAIKDFRFLIRDIFLYTAAVELAGSLSLYFSLVKQFPWKRAVVLSVFHSISGFCNAGFSLFSDSLVSYRENVWLNATMILLIVLGGLGFLVQKEVLGVLSRIPKRKKFQLSLHAKLVLVVSSGLVVGAFGLFLWMEADHSLKALSPKGKVLASVFQAVTPRTAGFNTVDMAALGTATSLLLMLLMFIGASPGSTGGGVKTSTVGVIFAFLRSKIMAKDSVGLFYRTIPSETITKSLTAISLALALVFLSSFVLVLNQPAIVLRDALFEVFSAFGTVGLSLGLTPRLNALGKIVIVLTMYIGRIGPLILLSAMSRHRPKGKFDYAEESVMIG